MAGIQVGLQNNSFPFAVTDTEGFIREALSGQAAAYLAGPISATAAATATSGTIATQITQSVQNGQAPYLEVSRVNPAAAITGVILQGGAFDGQTVVVVNEATALNTVTFAAAGTSNVAGGVGVVIPGQTAATFVWRGTLWYPDALASLPVVSASAVITSTQTIATAGVTVARVAPAAAVTGIILAQGTFNGQQVTVVNEGTGTASVTFAAAGTSFVADGVSAVISANTAKTFTYDTGTSLWYHN